MDLIDRFKYVMKLNQLSASAFAEEIGVQRSSVSHVLSGRNKPSIEFIQKILNRYPKVDANWLINGSTVVEKDKIKPASDQVQEPRVNDLDNNEGRKRHEVVEDEEQAPYHSKKATKKVVRIVTFFEDGTFQEHLPAS